MNTKGSSEKRQKQEIVLKNKLRRKSSRAFTFILGWSINFTSLSMYENINRDRATRLSTKICCIWMASN